jgi:pentose-5-phosphate-3-epimerase
LCKEQEVDLCFAYTPCELRSYQRIDEIINRWAPHVSGFQVMVNDTIGYHGVELDIEVPSLIQRMRSMYDGDIAIDIGVQSSTWRSLIDAGANRLISGSLFFSVDDPTQLVEDIASYKAKV